MLREAGTAGISRRPTGPRGQFLPGGVMSCRTYVAFIAGAAAATIANAVSTGFQRLVLVPALRDGDALREAEERAKDAALRDAEERQERKEQRAEEARARSGRERTARLTIIVTVLGIVATAAIGVYSTWSASAAAARQQEAATAAAAHQEQAQFETWMRQQKITASRNAVESELAEMREAAARRRQFLDTLMVTAHDVLSVRGRLDLASVDLAFDRAFASAPQAVQEAAKAVRPTAEEQRDHLQTCREANVAYVSAIDDLVLNAQRNQLAFSGDITVQNALNGIGAKLVSDPVWAGRGPGPTFAKEVVDFLRAVPGLAGADLDGQRQSLLLKGNAELNSMAMHVPFDAAIQAETDEVAKRDKDIENFKAAHRGQ